MVALCFGPGAICDGQVLIVVGVAAALLWRSVIRLLMVSCVCAVTVREAVESADVILHLTKLDLKSEYNATCCYYRGWCAERADTFVLYLTLCS